MGFVTTLRIALTAGAVAAFALDSPRALAADLGGDCCADLEERIAELEATTARKGNRKVSLTITGAVHQAVLFWDDGEESNAYVVGNKNDQTNFQFFGEADIGSGWKAGYDITVRIRDTLSDSVDQTSDDDVTEDGSFQLWQSHWWIENKTLGKVSVGQASRATDTVPEHDLSEAGVAGYAGVQDIGGSFFPRRKDDGLAGVVWGDLINHFNGDTANLVRYDTPELIGFVATATWGEDDIWDVALVWTGEGGGFKAEAAIGYTEVTDNDGEFAGADPATQLGIDQSTVVGSVTVLHEPSGLNLTVAAGRREFEDPITDTDGVLRTQADAKYVYVKPGWIAKKLSPLGMTAFYGEYARFEDFVTAGATDDDGDGIDDIVSSLAATGFDCGTPGSACRITGSKVDVWGLGVVQHIEAAEMQVYIGYRNYSAEFDLVDGEGSRVRDAEIEDFDTIITGSKISF